MGLTSREARRLSRALFDDWTPAGPTPERIAGYRIVGVIGSGAMGTVYEAWQESPPRPIALKVMKPGIPSSKGESRIRHEAEVLARLRHPAIAQVYEAGTHDDGEGGVPYFAMEYVPNARPLTQYADERGLSTRQRVGLLAPVCDAVHHGHQRGIIHRDLKPANILVDDGGFAKVIDFGVARATDSDVTVTTLRADPRQLVGTLQYMSPEQCDTELLDVDVRSDVYALGVVLYELVCGRLPYNLSGMSIAQALTTVRQCDPPRPSTHRRAIRGDLETVLRKALEKNRERRYRSAAQFADDLRNWLRGDPVAARPPEPWSKAAKWSRRHPLVATAAGCAVMVSCAIALTFAAVWYLSRVPYRVVITDDEQEAWLLSAAGAVLHRWRSDGGHPINFGRLVEDHRGRKIALVGYYRPGGTLSAFEWTRLGARELWSASVAPGEMPASLTEMGYTAGAFGMLAAWEVDLFPDEESPGPEIVAAYVHGPGSLCVLRAYDLEGQVRFEMWHDGHITSLHWMEPERLLVLSGLAAEALWPERGFPEIISGDHPLLVMAVRPRVDWRGTERIAPGKTDGDGVPLWYQTLLPADSAVRFQIHLNPPGGDDPPTGAFRLVLALKNAPNDATASILVDKGGHVVPDEEWATNQYRALQGAPDLREIRLGDFPPITNPRD